MSIRNLTRCLVALAVLGLASKGLAQSGSSNSFGLPAGGAGGISNFQVQTSSVSSGAGRTPSSASIGLTPGRPTGGATSKPFANVSFGPRVSPYLNLFNTGVGGASASVDNYNLLVRPQLEQQRTNRQLQIQQQRLNQRVQAISAQPAFQQRGSEQVMPTGHSTVFGYYSRFYPALNRRR